MSRGPFTEPEALPEGLRKGFRKVSVKSESLLQGI